MAGSERPQATQALARRIAVLALLAAVYVGAAKLGLLMDAVSGFATLVWPATGIALVALLRFGLQLWPGIAVGAFVVNLWTGAPPFVALGIAAGNTAEALLGAWAVRRFTGLDKIPLRLSHVAGLVALAAIASTAVSATIGTLSLHLGGIVAKGHVAQTWRAWWLGDATGDLIFAPLLLAWSVDLRGIVRHAQLRWRAIEALALGASLVGMALLVFDSKFASGSAFTQVYVLFPLLIWAAIRFGLRGATAATFAVSVLAISGTARGHGPFVHDRLATGLIYLQVFMAIVAVTTLVLSVAIAERNRAIESRNWFLAAVSHDLKNPLQMIELSSELLARVMPPEEKRARKLVADLRAASDRMSALVRDLLDVAAIEAGHFTIDRQPVEAAALVDEVAASARTLAEAKSQSLITTMARRDLVVRCDRRRVAQVLINLVDNAVKYSPDGTTITLTVDGDAAGVRFAVADAGPGIPAADARKVFDPFWRRSDSAKRGNSTGLGLTVAKTIVEAHGGRIWVESAGTGSTFAFWLAI